LTSTLAVVKLETLIRWHRKGFRLCWRWKSQPQGRPRVPADLRQLIAEMSDHPTAEWTAQQLRMVVPGDQSHRFIVHDHDSIYSEGAFRISRRVDRLADALCPLPE